MSKLYIIVGLLILVTIVTIVILVILYNKSSKDNYKEDCKAKTVEKYRENFPQTSSYNLLYTDQNGNLGATSDVGISDLTVNNNFQVGGKTTISGKTIMNGGLAVSGATAISGATTISGGVTVDTLNSTSTISSPTINTINSTLASLQTKIDTINATLTDLSTNIIRKDKVYAIVNNSTGENTTGNRNALLYGNACNADAKWKFIQKLPGDC